MSDVLGSTQQFRDVAMLHHLNLEDFSIPRLGNKKLSEFKSVKVEWELIDVSEKSNKVIGFQSFDLSQRIDALRLAIFDLNN